MQNEYSKLQEDSTPIRIPFSFDLNTFIFFLRHEYYAQPGHSSRLVYSWLCRSVLVAEIAMKFFEAKMFNV